jgi:hypothetical protein
MESNLNIAFISTNQDITLGSYRIWVNDLSHYLDEINVKSTINRAINDIELNTVIIFAKSDIKKLSNYRKRYPKNIIGIINPKAGITYPADFIIVGSIEEKDSLAMNKNVFIFPLIENKYRNVDKKKHLDRNDKIVLGVHGSHTHLSKFNPHLKEGIEEFSKECNIILKVITKPNPPKWKIGRPNIANIDIIPWDLDTFSQEILSCDIGLIPNITDNTPLLKITNKKRGLYTTDYFFRMKNKSNSGRMFVFIQHGIPVIADLTPSNLHILGSPDNGYAVLSKDGWLNALRELAIADRRNKIANNALEMFNNLYDPIEWTTKLVNDIERLKW